MSGAGLAGPALAQAEPPSFDAVTRLIASRGLRYAQLWFSDLGGRPWRITMPAHLLVERLFSQGLPLDGQPVGGAWNGVMLLMPRLDAVYVDATSLEPSLAMFCDVLEPGAAAPLSLEPRHVLERAARRVEQRLGAGVMFGVEPEFILQDSGGQPAEESVVWDFLCGLSQSISEAGVQVDWFRTGPAAGQGRVQMRAGQALHMADRVMFYRHLAANLARKRALSAVFLPRPAEGGGAPGMPMHVALWKGGVNLFHDESGWARTSPLCRSFARGLLAHLPALLAFCAPTTNSYRRLIAGVSGPAKPILSTEDRMAACRIPARAIAPGARRVKFCCPDSTANPYLAFAAVILAGLEGVEIGLEAPVDGSTPMDVRVPHCLESALESLERDREFLTGAGVFSNRLIDAWNKDRWSNHILPVRFRPHPWELSRKQQNEFTSQP